MAPPSPAPALHRRVLRKPDGRELVLYSREPPTRGEHPYAHVHVEIYPWLRMPDRLKYLAGSELDAGVFTADTLPEAKAREPRAVEVP